MADRGVDLSALPKEVRDQLAELDLELSEGKEGEVGMMGLMVVGDAVAHFQASGVCFQDVWAPPVRQQHHFLFDFISLFDFSSFWTERKPRQLAYVVLVQDVDT